jgi:ComF family protein
MLHDLLRLVFPAYCYACSQSLVRGEYCVCTDCRIKLPYTNLHTDTTGAQQVVARRFWGKVRINYVLPYLYFRRAGRVQKLLHQLKYKGAKELGEALGHWYGGELKGYGFDDRFDLVVPVPLHARKLRQRGYNQSSCFATGLARELGLVCRDHLLVREKESDTQTRKTREERWQNVEGIFKVTVPQEVKDKRILLVDDVITTGATLEACATALLAIGCKEVSVAIIAAAE